MNLVLYYCLPAYSSDPKAAEHYPAIAVPHTDVVAEKGRTAIRKTAGLVDLFVFDASRGAVVFVSAVTPGDDIGQYSESAA